MLEMILVSTWIIFYCIGRYHQKKIDGKYLGLTFGRR